MKEYDSKNSEKNNCMLVYTLRKTMNPTILLPSLDKW